MADGQLVVALLGLEEGEDRYAGFFFRGGMVMRP